MDMSDTPETDAFMTRIRGIDGDKHWVPADTAKRLERERNEVMAKYDILAVEHMLEVHKLCKERDEAMEQIKELIYIAARAIDLADIDFENDKFGVVSELRGDLEKIKKSK